jgi:hypothetical protein
MVAVRDAIHFTFFGRGGRSRRRRANMDLIGWSTAAVSTPLFDGQYLSDAEDVIVVTVNFRINVCLSYFFHERESIDVLCCI